ncbi:hypothetical protein [Streptomyces lancefieldiae]|uniref:Secreted protein n=1 Tax=Streptomyces lancefieldiae TaxID=3075520 RepID=A0ABU3AND6_9ACTN|nr:hypothetical protein [Streptomyces sp. DSM 40712]MDT0611370.1 hypothetical protein [Streptomyces sp. DSM 40712]
MSWTRGVLAVLAVCVLLTGSAGCGSSDTGEPEARDSATPVGRLLDDTDEEGRRYREVDGEHAPEVGIEVQPESDDSWDVRLTVRNFRFSPAGAAAKAVAGRGVAHLFLDGDLLTRLRGPEYRLAADLVPRGTHQVTVRLYADDGTVWAVDGKPVESTADLTASEPEPTAATEPGQSPEPGRASASGGAAEPSRASGPGGPSEPAVITVPGEIAETVVIGSRVVPGNAGDR